jgi:hypothetical protein
MRRMTVVAVATMLVIPSALAIPPAFGQVEVAAGPAPVAAKPQTVTSPAVPRAPAIKQAAASTPESRSAAALALSHEPTYDEGTAARIREAALSYSDLAVRGGWPTIPADAKFAIGTAGAPTTICCANV